MQLTSAWKYPFRGPNVAANLACAAVCFLIPIVGPMVFMGYLIRAEILLIQNPDSEPPRFDFGRFTAYLTRGVQVFLVSLICSLIFVPIMWVFMFSTIIFTAALAQKHPLAAAGCILGAVVIFIGFSAVFGMLTAPMYLKAALEDRFAAGFDMRFVADYLKRVGLLALGTQILVFLMTIPFLLIACIPIIGAYVAITLISFVGAHIRVQLYLEYLARGGTPINIKYDPPDPAFPVIPNPPQNPPPTFHP